VPADEKTFEYLKERARDKFEPVYADKDAKYWRNIILMQEILNHKLQNRMRLIMYQELEHFWHAA